ncbi:hypothetical protein PTSG_05766 [Salpingoeca rosetta]|uniref:Uncharacterized protein n=1 Tax=Salpingoeca rosetta (strain ATCC 50818 / BSB-021) TaxID=946362 RepID=F2UB61_SALR5|nr:uncharacterized protein PTSG_05766 [Salpingoeca rosetta]EGD74074.1 hypothetical protein PTSG_05766 [Salpingoeca rosetta]|eukprot:XP_004993636.1 hypothetical protein PTSG_05766 [Salpingoeca rosetta]
MVVENAVQVEAHASRRVQPDMARLVISIKSEKSDFAEAQESVNKRHKWVIHLLAEQSVRKADVNETMRVTKGETSISIVKTTSVLLRNKQSAEAVLSQICQKDIDKIFVDEVEYVCSQEQLSSTSVQLTDTAMTDALAKIKAACKRASLQATSVVHVSEHREDAVTHSDGSCTVACHLTVTAALAP